MRTQTLQLILFALLLLATTAAGHEKTLRISFDDLDSLVANTSPLARTRVLELDRVLAARDADLRWSNPQLAYGREAVEDELEQEITLGKSFELPWKTSRRRAEWEHNVAAATLRHEQIQRQQLADVRTGYVALRLLQQQLNALEKLGATLDDVGRVADARHAEGRISGIEARQIRLAAVSVAGTRLALLAEYRLQSAEWIASLGFDSADNLRLTSAVGLTQVVLPDEDELTAAAFNTPELRAMNAEQMALSTRADVERSWLLPEVSVSGGYKTIDPDLRGYVAGVSLHLPLFSQNGASIREADVERALVETQTEIVRAKIIARVNALLRSIREIQVTLSEFTSITDANPDALDDLLAAYKDGWLSLPDLLDAVQLEAGSLADYSNLLLTWYDSLFALEALTGAKLVRLPQE